MEDSFTGLGLGHGGRTTSDSLPKPSLRICPSWFVLPGSNVTLRCQAPIRDVHFVFRKSKQFLISPRSPDATESQAEFPLVDVQQSDSGEYTCEYSRRSSHGPSPLSDVVLLLVTGSFPKPSLDVHVRRNVTAGETVTLDCRKSGNKDRSLQFALLKEGTSEPIKVQRQERRRTQFLLQNVSVNDSGKYSCVYFQPEPPFWASHISDRLEIWVTASQDTAFVKDYNRWNLTRLGLTAVILMTMGAFLLEAWLSQKKSSCGSRSHSFCGE
ncbi:T-cell-interacting, activating receptor on myeloid cells protein 1 [Echinops telfairi]|uniref:T-cell-interacting, activating receptor on myeloid cells protein 1 n=1 Tax=Echinops telfairi TaxID=9371 RepID=UPI001E1DB5D4|nr:T-cell-interacting, activating receptor on myeloid cells protein 1 [Echinops telfairi]